MISEYHSGKLEGMRQVQDRVLAILNVAYVEAQDEEREILSQIIDDIKVNSDLALCKRVDETIVNLNELADTIIAHDSPLLVSYYTDKLQEVQGTLNNYWSQDVY